MSYASVHLTMPPSANRMWRKATFGMRPSAEYEQWKRAAGQEVMVARRNGLQFDGPVSVVIVLRRVHHGRDLDNCLKPILDALEFGQMIRNDNQVVNIHMRWMIEGDQQIMDGRDVCVEIRSET